MKTSKFIMTINLVGWQYTDNSLVYAITITIVAAALWIWDVNISSAERRQMH